MQVVIDIDEEDYEYVKGVVQKEEYVLSKFYYTIANGIPLPKGHGDLITKEQAIDLVEFYQINPQHFDFVNLIGEIKDEKPIIEADKAESEEKE